MNIKDKIRAEIERLYYNEAEKDESILAADAYKNALDAVEKFLDTLLEQPASESSEKIGQLNVLPKSARRSEGLEEAAFSYENDIWESGFKECGYSPQELSDAFKAGAEWMAGQGEVLTTETIDELCYNCHDRIPELIEKTSLSADDRVELIVRKIKED